MKNQLRIDIYYYIIKVTTMRLSDLIIQVEGLRLMSESSIGPSFNVAARSLLSTINSTASGAEEALKWRDRSRVMPVMRDMYQWFRHNYESNSGYNLRSILTNLKNSQPKYAKLADRILSVPSLPNGAEGRIGAEGKVLILSGVLAELVKNIHNDSRLGTELHTATNRLSGILTQLRAIKWDDIGVDSKDTRPTIKQPSVMSQQNQQVEVIVNGILKDLPSNVAGEIRNAIAKSDNKLAALQAEMKKRGL